MKRYFYLLLTPIIALLVGCKEDDPERPTFNDRLDLEVLDDVPGTMKYYCGNDTAFFYLQTADGSNLIVDQEESFRTFFSTQWAGDVDFLLNNPCTIIASDIQNPEFQVIISGRIKESLTDDDFLVDTAQPFVMDALGKVEACPVDYVENSQSFPFHNTRWRVVEVNFNEEQFYPTCEYNNILVVLTLEASGTGYVFEYHNGNESCEYVYTVSGADIAINQNQCNPTNSSITRDMLDFNSSFFEVLLDPGKTSGTFQYQMNGNILQFLGKQGGSVRLIGT